MNKCEAKDTDFRSIFYKNLPHKPYCMDEIPGYMNIRPKAKAIETPYLQINPPCLVTQLIFDIDKSDAFFAWSDANLPQPNWIAKNPKNGHAHIGYMLAAPVCVTNNARQRVVRYLACIQQAYTLKLGADNGYVGLIAKNPLHEKWDNHILSSELYDLNYLADFVNLEQLPRNQHVSGLGRNCTLFDIVRIWAYKAIREHSDSYYAEWEAEVLTRALHANTAFSSPLEYQEVKQTARSIAKWVWRNHGSAEFQANFSAKQAKKGRKGGLKSDSSQGGKARSQQYSDMRHEALKLHLQGMKQIDIAKQLNVSDRTIRTWIKNRKVQA
ncbi:TPA: replication initiation protein [Acinetobacter baumannii]|jgi:hypothetical protein|nr:replication initiation protein [Acinetobacter baumannii]